MKHWRLIANQTILRQIYEEPPKTRKVAEGYTYLVKLNSEN